MSQPKTHYFLVILSVSCLFLGNQEFANSEVNSTFFNAGQSFNIETSTFTASQGYSQDQKDSVSSAVNYWNNLTNNSVKSGGKDYNINFYLDSLGPGTLGQSFSGKPYIGYNTDYNYDLTISNQIKTSDTNLRAIAIHEIGHQMGITSTWTDKGTFEDSNKKQYEDYVFNTMPGQEKWVNSVVYYNDVTKNYVSAKGLHSTIDGSNIYSLNTIVGLIQNKNKFFFNGIAANEVYGDTWIKGPYNSKPTLEIETGQTAALLTTSNNIESISAGSILVHPYTRFGIMNAVSSADSRPFFSEVELAVLNDLLTSNSGITGSINIKDYFGRSVYTDGNSATSSTVWSSNKPYAVGLHLVGDNNTITQNANIGANGVSATGIRVEGQGNKVIIDSASTISANGVAGIGVMVTHGKDAVVNNKGTIEATDKSGTAVYMNSGAWTDFNYSVAGSGILNNTGKISAKQGNAIAFDYSLSSSAKIPYPNVTPDSYVPVVNLMGSSQLEGNITTLNDAKGIVNLGYTADTNGNQTSTLDNNFKLNYKYDITGKITLNNKAGETTFNKSTIDVQTLNVDLGSKILGTADIAAVSTQNNGDITANSLYVGKDSTFTGNYISNTSSTTLNNATVLGSFTENKLTVNNGNFYAYANHINLMNSPFIISDLTLNNAYLTMMNSSINNMQADKITANNSNFAFDVNLAGKSIDTITTKNPVQGTVNIVAYNTLSDSTAPTTLQPIIGTDEVTINSTNSAMSKILKYGVTANGNKVTFNQNGYNPAVLASPVAAQLGGYLIQLNSFEQGFQQMDNIMNFSSAQRITMRDRNKYAAADSTVIYNPNKENAGWFSPYTSFENVNLDNGPSVNGITYGSYFGGNSELYELKNGWQGLYGVYGGYNGGYQYYDGVSMNENGGTVGISGMLVKNNLFTGLTVNAGGLAGQANTMYGLDNFTMLTAGIASKTGYNFEFKEGKYILQPNFMMGYSFINTFNYTNAAGVEITSDPLNAITIAPGIKAIMNLKNGWQPYLAASMMWNILDKSKVSANDIPLPDMSIKPFIQYGIGIQKVWGERFTGFAQAMIRNGGRNGIALKFGFNYALGKAPGSGGKESLKNKSAMSKLQDKIR